MRTFGWLALFLCSAPRIIVIPDNLEEFENARFSLGTQDAPIGFVGAVHRLEEILRTRGAIFKEPLGTQVGKVQSGQSELNWAEVIGEA